LSEYTRRALGIGTVVAAMGILLTAGFVVAMGATNSTHATNVSTTGSASAPPGSGHYFPTPIRHVVTILLENEEASSVYTAGPYESFLAQHYTYTAEDYGVSHPSEPNYLALTGGSIFGRNGTDAYTVLPNVSIADLLELRGESWGEFAQSMPTPCGVTDVYPYAVKHNPFVFYQDIVSNATRCNAHVTDFAAWTADVAANDIPNYAFITPNLLNDGHDTGVSYADAWLEGWLSPLLTKPFASSTLFIVTYDEGATNEGYTVGNTTVAGGNVFTVFVSPYTLNGGFYAAPVSHYNVLTTTEWLLGVGSLGTNDSVITFPPMVTAFHFGDPSGSSNSSVVAGAPAARRV
jgi:Phosphoesterase family